jgi:hypothetical protein
MGFGGGFDSRFGVRLGGGSFGRCCWLGHGYRFG